MANVRQSQPTAQPDQVANAKVFTVALRKSVGGGLGLGILKDCGGPCESGFVRVHELYPGQPAQLCGRLRTGDVILKVNGVRLLGKSTAQALEILRAASGLVTLTVYRQHCDQNRNISASGDELSQCRRTEPEGVSTKRERASTFAGPPRSSSSSHGSSERSESTAALSQPGSPLDSALQLACPLPRPKLRNSQSQDGVTRVGQSGRCDFDVVTDGRVFGDLCNGAQGEKNLPRHDAPFDPSATAPTTQCRRHKSVGARVSAPNDVTLFEDSLNGLVRHGSSNAVRSCFNNTMFAADCGEDDAGLARWRDTVLTEESDDSHAPQLNRVKVVEPEEASSGSASSIEIECVSVKLHRGWHTKLGFSLRNCEPGARDTPNAPVVKAVYPGSLASRDGRIRTGDFLVQVNGCDFIGCCASDAVDYIKKCSGTLALLFIRVHKSDAILHQ